MTSRAGTERTAGRPRTTLGRAGRPEGREGREGAVAGQPHGWEIDRLFVALHPHPKPGRGGAQVPQELTERIWRALGFATLADDAVAFSDGDVAALQAGRAMLGGGLWTSGPSSG